MRVLWSRFLLLARGNGAARLAGPIVSAALLLASGSLAIAGSPVRLAAGDGAPANAGAGAFEPTPDGRLEDGDEAPPDALPAPSPTIDTEHAAKTIEPGVPPRQSGGDAIVPPIKRVAPRTPAPPKAAADQPAPAVSSVKKPVKKQP